MSQTLCTTGHSELAASPEKVALQDYFLKAVRDILRPASGCLKYPYLVPGGNYFDQLWDWDSFWVAKGYLTLLPQMETRLAQEVVEAAKGSWLNFLENQAENGAVPILIKSDNRDVFNCASDHGTEHNQAKPILAQLAWEIVTATGDAEWARPYFPRLMKFYDRWFNRYGTASGLLVWGSDVAIGVDNDPTTYGRPEFSSANLLLNCFCYKDLVAGVQLAQRLGMESELTLLRTRAEGLKAAILQECWDESDGFFYTVDVQCEDARDKYIPKNIPRGMDFSWKTLPLKVKVFTGFLPMWCGIATPRQAQIMVDRHLHNENEFNAPYGVPSLAKIEKMYAPEVNTANPSNWLGPVWILSNYMVYSGLKSYGFDKDASVLAAKTRTLLSQDIQQNGTIHEYYHPDTGFADYNAGFLSWNVLAALMD
ncbi:MAG: hypothetical protein B9S32_05775 [Verrucomicrobia bacterium Tous-C9LFEB]|nr:MAG: hypothetical protein B9S32_05775 [Verrucomicrobia bacterium Tous-C9LFEB]